MLFEDMAAYCSDVKSVLAEGVPRERIGKRWRYAGPSEIWIPSRLLPGRKGRRDDPTNNSAFHILQRYESQDFCSSFSTYSDSGSDPEGSLQEEFFHDYAKKVRNNCSVFDDLLSDSDTESFCAKGKCGKVDNDSVSESRTDEPRRGGPPFADSLDKFSKESLVGESPSHLVPEMPSNQCPERLVVKKSSNCCTDDTAMVSGCHGESEISPLLDPGRVRDSSERFPVVEAEFVCARKKSKDNQFEKKMGSKKEKRNKSKGKITMPLDHFWQTIDSDEFQENNDFYESVMREQENAQKHVKGNSVCEFPQIYGFPDDVQYNGKRMQSRDVEKKETFVKEKKSSIFHDASMKVKDDDVGIGGKVLVMENIPEDVEEEMVSSLVLNYGQLIQMKKSGEFSTAEFWIPPDVELDWLISCFDGHQPFGAYSSVLHCYEKGS